MGAAEAEEGPAGRANRPSKPTRYMWEGIEAAGPFAKSHFKEDLMLSCFQSVFPFVSSPLTGYLVPLDETKDCLEAVT